MCEKPKWISQEESLPGMGKIAVIGIANPDNPDILPVFARLDCDGGRIGWRSNGRFVECYSVIGWWPIPDGAGH